MTILKKIRPGLVGLGILALLAAMWAGLLRMGWAIPLLQPTLAASHGPLMVSGFLGTLVGMERAVGLNKAWAYLSPILTGLGGIILMAGLSPAGGALAITGGSIMLVVIFSYIVRHEKQLHSWVLFFASLLWVAGNLLWLGGLGIPLLVGWWMGYLILTIAGERLELSRLIQVTTGAKVVFLAIGALFVAGLATVPFDYTLGWRITGAGMLGLAVWLLRQDIARRTIKQVGLTRFIASCMLSGYVWLGISGAMALIYGFVAGGIYDAVLHSVFLGFVVTMIFGHAPVIFPAVLGVQMKFSKMFYAHLALLHLSLLLRVGADLVEWQNGRLWGAMINVIAMLFFLFNTIRAIIEGRKAQARIANRKPPAK